MGHLYRASGPGAGAVRHPRPVGGPRRSGGDRLGRGGGYYDRSLGFAGPHTRLLALLDAENVVDCVPVERHDRAVDAVITEDGLLDFGTWHSTE